MAPISIETNDHSVDFVKQSAHTLVKRLDDRKFLFCAIFIPIIGAFMIPPFVTLCWYVNEWFHEKNEERKRRKAERLALKQRQLEARNLIHLKENNGFTGYDFKPGKQLISAAENGYVDPVKFFGDNSPYINSRRSSFYSHSIYSSFRPNATIGEGLTLPEPVLNDHYDLSSEDTPSTASSPTIIVDSSSVSIERETP